MNKYDFYEKIGFFFTEKGITNQNTWEGRLSKQQQINAFGFYLGKGLIKIDQLKMVVTHTVRIAFGAEAEVNKSLTINGFSNAHGKLIPLEQL